MITDQSTTARRCNAVIGRTCDRGFDLQSSRSHYCVTTLGKLFT